MTETQSEIDRLAKIIREVDGDHCLGAAALAERILERWSRRAPVTVSEAAGVLLDAIFADEIDRRIKDLLYNGYPHCALRALSGRNG